MRKNHSKIVCIIHIYICVYIYIYMYIYIYIYMMHGHTYIKYAHKVYLKSSGISAVFFSLMWN